MLSLSLFFSKCIFSVCNHFNGSGCLYNLAIPKLSFCVKQLLTPKGHIKAHVILYCQIHMPPFFFYILPHFFTYCHLQILHEFTVWKKENSGSQHVRELTYWRRWALQYLKLFLKVQWSIVWFAKNIRKVL